MEAWVWEAFVGVTTQRVMMSHGNPPRVDRLEYGVFGEVLNVYRIGHRPSQENTFSSIPSIHRILKGRPTA